jgi:uncharacterized membrane protein HdeD (DUF308 family)
MLSSLTIHWPLFVVRGLCAIAFGVLTLVWPNPALAVLVLSFGVYAGVDGVISWATAVRGGAPTSRWWLAIVGFIGIGTSALTFVWPALTAEVLLQFMAIWAIATGLVEMAGALQVRRQISREWLLFVSGVCSVVFGIVALRPSAGAVAMVVAIGAYAIVHGGILVSLALRLRYWHGVEVPPARPLEVPGYR